RRERDDEIAMLIGRDVRPHKETTVRRTREGLDALFDGSGIVFDRCGRDFNSERWRDRLRRAREIVVSEPLWIADQRCSGQTRQNLLDHSEKCCPHTKAGRWYARLAAPDWPRHRRRPGRTRTRRQSGSCGSSPATL